MPVSSEACCSLGKRLVAHSVKLAAANALAVDAAEGLELIRRDDLNLVYWTRRAAPNFASVRTAFPDARTPEMKAYRLSRVAFLQDCVTFAGAFDLQESAALTLFEEVYTLGQIFLDVAGTNEATVAIERLDHDGCRLFHTDNVRLRLLCTYCGRGTQWLPDWAVNRAMLGTGSNEAVCHTPGVIGALPRGAVGLFKGDGWQQRRHGGVVHRSPPAPGGRARRVLLRMDARA